MIIKEPSCLLCFADQRTIVGGISIAQFTGDRSQFSAVTWVLGSRSA